MATCPNKNLPEWNALEQKLGSSAQALAAYSVNNYAIPTPEEGEALLKAVNNGENTNPFTNKKTKQLKLDRVNEQIGLLTDTIDSTREEARKDVFNKLLKNLEEYKQVIENEEATVSVSNLTGGGEIENQQLYRDFAAFGNFVHFVVETLQKEVLLTKESITKKFTMNRMDSMMEAFLKTQKIPFTISGLVEDGEIVNMEELYNMTNDIVATLQGYIARDYMVLPELSLMGKDRYGRNIIGRIDIMCVSPKGEIAVLDIKTKKLNNKLKGDSLRNEYPVSPSKFTDEEFTSGSRNAYDNWDIQLNIYERMLQQIDISVNEKMILGLLYYGEYADTGEQFDEQGQSLFNYYKYKVNNIEVSENNKTSDLEILRYRKFVDKVKKVLPIQGETTSKITSEDNRAKVALDLPENEAIQFVEQLKEITDAEIYAARQKLQQIKKTDAGTELEKFWQERVNNLLQIRNVLDKNDNTWGPAYKIGHIIQTLDVNLKDLVNVAREMSNETDMGKKAKELERLNRAANGYNYFVEQLKGLLISANIPSDYKAMQTLNSIENGVREVSDRYNQMGLKFMIDVLKSSLTPNQLVRLTKDRKDAIEPIIAKLKSDKAQLESQGKKSGLFQSIVNATSKTPKTEIESIDLQITKLELELEGVKLDDESITKYIQSILDPKSPLYIGEGTTFFTQYLASASSSDWVLSSFTSKLKVALQEGNQEYVNFIEKEGIQTELDDYNRGNKNVKDMNDPISEVRKEIVYDEDGNESTVERRSFVNPLSEEYYNVFDRHSQRIKLLIRKIKEEGDPVKIKELKSEKAKLIQDHLAWRLENTQMKLRSELYELDKMLPADYKMRRDELYEEQNLLKTSAGYNNQEYLDDSTLERIAEIDVELNRLRLEYTSGSNEQYKRYMELRDKYYTYEINYNKYNQLLNQKKIELTDANGVLDIEKLEKWKQENTMRVPSQEYHDLVAEKWESIFAILGKSDPDIQALRDKKKEVLAQYRRKGMIDSRFMSQDDIETLESIDKMIEDIKKDTKSDLDYQDRMMLSVLFKELYNIQKKVENPIYLTEYKLRSDGLEQAWALYQAEEDGKTKDKLLEQFLLKEIEYKTWFDNNHTNTYETKLTRQGPVNPLPKGFNMIDVPVDESMVEEKPGFNFSSRVLKEEAYNPDYQEDALGYPLAKGLSRDGAKVMGDSKWLNDKYRTIRNNPATDKFYHNFVGRFLQIQSATTGKMLGYYFPGYEEKSLDDYMNKGIAGGVKNRIKMFKEKNLTVHGEYDFTVNNYNTTIEDRIQFKHNRPLPINQQTTDGIGAVIRWYENAFVNQKAAETQAMSKSMISYMESLYSELQNSNLTDKNDRMNKMKRVIDGMKFEYGKAIKGESKKDQGQAGRIGDMMLKSIGITRLAFDIPNQIGNLLSGNVQAYLGSHKSGLYSGQNYLWAKTKVEGPDGLFASLLRDYGKIGNKTFMTKMLLYFNPMQESLDHYYDKTRGTTQRLTQGLLDGNPMFFIQDKGELEIASTIWLSIMDANKVKLVKSRNEDGSVKEYETDLNGNVKTINAYEAYTQTDKKEIVIRQDVEFTKEDEQALMKSVWSEIRRTQGNYASADQTRAEEGLTGRLLVYYRKYLAPAIKNRFGRREENYEAAEMAYGFYRALVKGFQIYGTKKMLMSMIGAKGTGVSDFYNRKSVTAMREMIIAVGLYFLGSMIKGLYDDLEDDEDSVKRTILLNMMAIYSKVDMETRSLVPLPVAGGFQDYLENLGSFTNANRDALKVFQALDHGIFLGVSQFSDSELVQKRAFYQRDTGMFEEGDAKLKKDLMDISGYMNVYELFDPKTRVRNVFNKR
jgi:hypothetical protein